MGNIDTIYYNAILALANGKQFLIYHSKLRGYVSAKI